MGYFEFTQNIGSVWVYFILAMFILSIIGSIIYIIYINSHNLKRCKHDERNKDCLPVERSAMNWIMIFTIIICIVLFGLVYYFRKTSAMRDLAGLQFQAQALRTVVR